MMPTPDPKGIKESLSKNVVNRFEYSLKTNFEWDLLIFVSDKPKIEICSNSIISIICFCFVCEFRPLMLSVERQNGYIDEIGFGGGLSLLFVLFINKFN